MGMPVRIDDTLYEQARAQAQAERRTIAGQIEFWAMVGKAALDNPDLPIDFVRDLLIARTEGPALATPFVPAVQVLQSAAFRRAYKRLHANQKADVDAAVRTIVDDPTVGEAKKGDLAGVFVYKFKCVGQLALLAYEYDPATRLLLLLGSHENFYRELKRS